MHADLALPLTLFGTGEPSVSAPVSARVERTPLDYCCWVDVARGFVDGGDQLLVDLVEAMEWFRGRRLMYGTWHAEPRLTAQAARDEQDLPPVIDEIRCALTEHYERSFAGLFCNFYETGDDSVAWHADRIGRTSVEPLVAIVSLGGPRAFHLRSKDGGAARRFLLHSGDLLVMGGSTQHRWEHAVPKVRSAPPRMSVTMRAGGPRIGSGLNSTMGRTQANRRSFALHERASQR